MPASTNPSRQLPTFAEAAAALWGQSAPGTIGAHLVINPVQESANISEYGFVGGRRRHNATRRVQAVERRAKVRARVAELGWRYGTQAQVARELGVSEATVSRDLASIAPHVCPTCREPTTGRLWILMAAWPDNDYDDEDDLLDDDEEYGLRARGFRDEAVAELGHSLK